MKLDPSVRRATLIVAAGVLICSIIMQLIYLIVVLLSPLTWHYSFILGNLLMGTVVILNFFFMSYGMQQTIASGDTDGVRRRVQFNHLLRNLLMIGTLVIAFVFHQHFHIVATVVTIAFPQVTVLLSRLFLHDKEPESPVPATGDGDATEASAAPAVPDTGREEDNG